MALSVEDLLKPISEDQPCGEDLEYDPEFQQMETAFEETPEQEYGDTVIAGSGPDWKSVRDHAFSLLERTRDLRAMAYAAISSLHIDGLGQFRDILAGMAGCMQESWEGMHPELDPDDEFPIMRMNALQMMNERQCVPQGLERTVLVELRGIGEFSLRSIDIAEGRESPREDEPVPEKLAIQDAFAQADPEYLDTLLTAVDESLAHLAEISRVWDEKAGDSAPMVDFSLIIPTLQRLDGELREYIPGAAAAEGEVSVEGEAGAVPGQEAAISGAVNSRDDVVRVLQKVIDFYERNEPSSPVPLLVARAQTLVSKSFYEILQDIVPDSSTQAQVVCGKLEQEGY